MENIIINIEPISAWIGFYSCISLIIFILGIIKLLNTVNKYV